jgi:hypothetical protein
MKANTTLTIDVNLRNKARQLNINLSELFKESLINKIAILEEDVEGIDVVLIKRELEREERKLNNISGKVSSLRTKLLMIEEKKNKEQELKLKEEKKIIEELRKCKNCGVVIETETKFHDFPIGKICNACFISTPPKETKRWYNEKQ